MPEKIGMISLGCPKNQVDAEILLAKLAEGGFEITNDVDGADAVIVNTCAFIEDAKKEAIENILDMAELKKEGVIGKIIVTGCLAERYKEEILSEIPEIDAVVGIGSNADICDVCRRVLSGETVETFGEKTCLPLSGERLLTTPPWFAYLKIAEGCSNHCTYCAIPSIRGEFRSRPAEEILEEAKTLAENGVKELIVVAQDTTRYGEDLYGKSALPALLTALAKIDELKWIRVLYCYPERISDELIDVMASSDKILNYLDIPIQHADAAVLKAMNRKGDKESLLALLGKIREKMPDVVLRTTLITGFPGETEEAFETLCEFVKEARFLPIRPKRARLRRCCPTKLTRTSEKNAAKSSWNSNTGFLKKKAKNLSAKSCPPLSRAMTLTPTAITAGLGATRPKLTGRCISPAATNCKTGISSKSKFSRCRTMI